MAGYSSTPLAKKLGIKAGFNSAYILHIVLNLNDMRYAIFAAILCTLLSSCLNKTDQRNEKLILGNWVETSDNINSSKPDHMNSFVFNSNHTYTKLPGKFRNIIYSSTVIYSEKTSTYRIENNTLLLSSPDSANLNKAQILQLNEDTLKLNHNGIVTVFKHYPIQSPSFDKIILSASDCFGTHAAINIIISANDSVLFNGKGCAMKKGWYTGKITNDTYEQIQNNFRIINFNSLKKAITLAE